MLKNEWSSGHRYDKMSAFACLELGSAIVAYMILVESGVCVLSFVETRATAQRQESKCENNFIELKNFTTEMEQGK